MKSFIVPNYDEIGEAAHPTLDLLKKTMGFIPNLYATIGYSANALSSYMKFTGEQARGTFHAKDREAVYLIVSEINGCHYCLASHTESAIGNGWTEDATLLLRRGTGPDHKWEVIYKVIRSIIEHKGQVDGVLLEEFYALGFTESGIMDLLTLVMVMSFTNYAYRMTQIPIDFPLAKPID